jgi:tetratricopeptide (TPR) repeat protein
MKTFGLLSVVEGAGVSALFSFVCLFSGCADQVDRVEGPADRPTTESVEASPTPVRPKTEGWPPANVPEGIPMPPATERWPVSFEKALAAAYAGITSGEDGGASLRELAMLFHANAFLEDAAACYRLLEAREPRAARWVYFQALLRLDRGDLQAGSELLERTVALAPDYLSAWLKLGDVRFKSGSPEAAVEAYHQCFALDEVNPQAGLGLVQEHLRLGEYDNAHAVLEQVLRKTPEFGQGQKLMAQLLKRRGDSDGSEAARKLGEDHGQYPDPHDPWWEEVIARCYDVHQMIVMADANVVVGRFKAAFDLFSRAEAVAPENPKVPLIRGLRLQELGDLPAAVESLESAVRLGGDTTTAYAALAGIYRRQGDLPKAVATARHGLEENPDSVRLHTALGVLLLLRSELPEAERFLRQALKADPYKANAIRPLAQVLWDQGKEDEAVKNLRELRRLAPSDLRSRSFLASYYCERGEFAEGEPFLREALDLNPGDAELTRIMLQFLHAYGDELAEDGRHGEAVAYYREGLALDPEMVVLYRNLALASANIEDWTAAVSNMTRYLDERPEDLAMRVSLGDMQWANGDFAKARKQWTTARMLARGAGNPPDLLEVLEERLSRDGGEK